MPARFVPQVCGKPNSGCHPGAPPQPSHVGAVGTAVPTWGVLSIISSQAEAGTRAVAPRRSPEGDGYIIKASSCPKFLRLLGVRLWRWRQLMRPSPYSCAQTPTESNAPWAPEMHQCTTREDTVRVRPPGAQGTDAGPKNNHSSSGHRGPDMWGHEVI